MKKTALLTACLLALAACGGEQNSSPAPSEQTASTPATTDNTASAASADSKQETYIVGTDASYPPFDFKDDKGQITGFDVELLQAIAANQGFSVNFVSNARNTLFDSLGAGNYQILAACLGMSAERLAKSEMSEPYAFAPNVIMGKQGGSAKVLADLKDSKVATQEGSYTHEALKQAQVGKIVAEPSLYDAYTAFLRGDADYVVGDAGVLSYHNNAMKEDERVKTYTAVYDPSEDVRVGFAVQKGNTELIGKINAGLKAIKADGTYDKIYAKWFGDNDSLRVPKGK